MRFWQFRAAAGNPKIGELMLYGVISSETWWGDEVTPLTFKADLDALGEIDELHVFINSPGGDVFAGQAIHSMLKRHKAHVVVYVDGLAASIASVIAMAGDVVRMPRNAMMMIHNPWTIAGGNAGDFRKMADDLDRIRESILAAYEDKTGMSRDELIPLLDAETWLSADDAVAKGFANEIEKAKQVAASLVGGNLTVNGQTFDLSKYRNRPAVAEPDGQGRPQHAKAAHPNPPVVAEQGAAPLYDVGARVVVTDPEDPNNQQAGEVREATLTYVYGVKLDGSDGTLQQYVESDLVPEIGSEQAPTPATAAPMGGVRHPDQPGNLKALTEELTILRTQHNNLIKRVALIERSSG